MITKQKPEFIHDCEDCIFLGQIDGSDLYFHPSAEISILKTVIVRYSNDAPDYSSGLAFSKPYTDISGQSRPGIPELIEARKRAEQRGLL